MRLGGQKCLVIVAWGVTCWVGNGCLGRYGEAEKSAPFSWLAGKAVAFLGHRVGIKPLDAFHWTSR
jgi:hypothetical protein